MQRISPIFTASLSNDSRRPGVGPRNWHPHPIADADRALLRDLLFVLTAMVVMGCWLLTHCVAPHLWSAVYDTYSDALYLAAAVLCFGASRNGVDNKPIAGMRRPAMLLIGGGALSFGIGNIIWSWYVVAENNPAPFPSLADAGFLGMYPLVMAGILLLPSRSVALETRGRILLDALITLAAFSTFSWYFILGPTIQQSAGSLLAKTLAAGYPMGDLVLLVCLLVLAAQSRDSVAPRLVALLGAGLSAIIIADVLFGYGNLKGTYHDGELLDMGWPTGFLLFAIAMRAKRRLAIQRMEAPRPEAEAHKPTVPEMWRTFAPYCILPLLDALIIHMRIVHGDESLESGVYTGTAITVVLLLMRQGATMARLIRDLRERVVELESAKAKLTELAEIDSLTGLLNHRAMHAVIESELFAHPGEPVSLISMDMDSFKRINDAHGHPTGDRLLRHVAHTLQETFIGSTRIGRCGGDEFLVLLPGCPFARAAALTQELRQTLSENPFTCPVGDRIPVQVCFGIADSSQTSSDTSEPEIQAALLVAAADAALYESKQRGGGILTVHAQQDETAADSSCSGGSSFDILDGLITAIDNKDHFTRRHSEDVTRYCLMMVNALNLSQESIAAARLAGLLHDVGKIGIPDSILRKPGRLTQDEYEVMKNHVVLSSVIIHGLPHLSDILDGVANHHERWDGKGYPNRLKGEENPLLGRVMAVADAFSAMTLDRSYHAGMPLENALAEIEKGAGSQFDPELATLFVDTMRKQFGSAARHPLAGLQLAA